MRKIISLTAATGALFLVISCASTPPKPAAPVTEAPSAQPVQPGAPDAELAQANSLQKKVDAYGLGTYDPGDYAAANKDLAVGKDAYGKDNAASRKSLQSAIAEYNAVIAKGGPLFLAQAQAKAEASKKAADDLKASVAVKDDYTAANDVYMRALKEKDAVDIENASRDFGQAGDQFDSVAKVAKQKRDAAVQALQAAQQDQTKSQQKADEAQKALADEGFSAAGSAQ